MAGVDVTPAPAAGSVNHYPGRALLSTAEAAWWAAAAASDGAYSPIAGPHSISFVGGHVGLAKTHDVDTSGLTDEDPSRLFELQDARGRTWYARTIGSPLWVAWRDRDYNEMAERIDRIEDARSAMVRWVQLNAAKEVAWHLRCLASWMRPEKVAPRSARRHLKRRFLHLADLQIDLLTQRWTSREIAKLMQEAELYWPGTDYKAWLDRCH